MGPSRPHVFLVFLSIALLPMQGVQRAQAVEVSSTTVVHKKHKAKVKKKHAVMTLSNDALPKNGQHYIMVPPESGPDYGPPPPYFPPPPAYVPPDPETTAPPPPPDTV